MNFTWFLTFQDNSWYCWRLAGTNIYIRRTGSLWQSCYRQIPWNESAGTYSCPAEEAPDNADSIGDAINSGALKSAVWTGKTATLQVCFPEKPFLLDLGGITMYPGMDLLQELQLPPAFRLIPGETNGNIEQPEILFSYTPFFLKDAWFGKDTMRGNLYSALPSSFSAPAHESLGIYCPLHIRSHVKTMLELNRVPLYTDTLAIYEKNGKFVSDKPIIDVFGDDFRETVIKEQGSLEQGTLLAHPVNKNGVGDSLIRRGTQIIKEIARYK